jgi:hypothetical protein
VLRLEARDAVNERWRRVHPEKRCGVPERAVSAAVVGHSTIKGSLPDPPSWSCTLRRRLGRQPRRFAQRRLFPLGELEQSRSRSFCMTLNKRLSSSGMSRIRSATSFILTQMGPPTNRRLNWAPANRLLATQKNAHQSLSAHKSRP